MHRRVANKNSTGIGAAVGVTENTVTVIDIEEPDVAWKVNEDRIVNVLKDTGIE